MMIASIVLWIATLVVGTAGVLAWTTRLSALTRLPPSSGNRTARVSVIVPARDEAENLPRLLASLAALDPPPAEVIVVDDHSTDGTGDLARAAGATVVVPPPLPAGWLGKSWACHAGAQVATGDLLLFTDADTEHGPASIGQATALLDARGAALVSAVPEHRVVAGWEALQGPFQLLLLAACSAGASREDGGRFAIGQYLLFRRDAYERAGGHTAVAGRIAEDLHLAARVAERGGEVAILRAPGALRVRMYPGGVGDFARGWRRSIRAGLGVAGAGGGFDTAAIIGWLLGVPLSLAAALVVGDTAMTVGFALAYLATAAELAVRQRLVGALPRWSALAYPLAVLAFVGISAAAAIDHLRRAPVRWRGRAVRLERP